MEIKEFGRLLDEFFEHKRNEMKNQYSRVLPSGELIFNRFDKASYCNCGERSSIYDTSVIMGNVSIGKSVWIGPYTMLEGINADLIIEDFVSINTGVCIFTHDSTKYHLSGGKSDFEVGKVKIGHNSVIGTMSMVNYGVTIGHHCVVAAHSFVKDDVPDYAIVAGIPAHIIGRVVINDGEVGFHYFASE